MEEQGVIRLRVFHQPMHCPQDVLLRRLAHGILLVVGQDDHIFSGITKVLVQIGGHVFDIVDASSQLPSLAEVVDPDQQSFPPTGTRRILEIIALWGALAKANHP